MTITAAGRIIPQEHANNAHAHFHLSFSSSLHMHPIYGPFYFISSNMHLSPTSRGIALHSNLILPSKSKTCCKTFRSTEDLKRCDAYFWDYLRKKSMSSVIDVYYLLSAMNGSLLTLSDFFRLQWMSERGLFSPHFFWYNELYLSVGKITGFILFIYLLAALRLSDDFSKQHFCTFH